MTRLQSRWPTPRALPVLVTALLSSGCGGVLGPEAMPVARVRGIVREGERPVGGGWIEFCPVDGTIGKLRSARIAADGSFDADGVAVGENAIRLVNPRVEKTPYLRLFGFYSSPIRREVPANASAPLHIDLVEETLKFQKSRRQAAPQQDFEPGGPR